MEHMAYANALEFPLVEQGIEVVTVLMSSTIP